MRKQYAILGIACVGIISLMLRVWDLGAVDQVIFDEVHFGKFISSYCCTHERFFDIHPPVGKLLIAGGTYIAGGTNGFDFDHIGQPYQGVSAQALRMVPALAGSLLPIIIIILLRQIGVSWIFSLLGGFAIAFDNALILESRLIVTDSILLTATFGALAGALAAAQSSRAAHAWRYMGLSGLLCGIAVGTKFTGLLALALVFLIAAYRAYGTSYREAIQWLLRFLFAALIALAVYLLGWSLHFALLSQPGSGDAWGIPSGMFWQDLIAVHRQMLFANYNLSATHPYGSAWFTWPLMIRSVFYWQGDGNQYIYLLGNPALWWGSFAGLCMCIGMSIARIEKGRGNQKSVWVWVFLIGYFLSYVPLMRVPRVLFLYHYMTPLIFSLLCAIWWLDAFVHRKKIIFFILCILLFLGFFLIMPITYGVPLSPFWYNAVFFITSWR